MSIELQKIQQTLSTTKEKSGRIIKILPSGITVSFSTGGIKIVGYQTGFKIGDKIIIGETGLIKVSAINTTKEYEV